MKIKNQEQIISIPVFFDFLKCILKPYIYIIIVLLIHLINQIKTKR